MQDVNSHGRAQHSAKSINLEANILSEWCVASTILHRQLKERFIALVVVTAVSLVLIPFLWSTSQSAAKRVESARKRNTADTQALGALNSLTVAAQPLKQEEDRLAESKTNLQALLGNVRLVIDAVPTSVAFDSLQCDVSDAQLTITCKSQAETTEAGQTFVDAASLGQNVQYAVQVSTMKSAVLGKDGVAFDFIKKVNLQP